MRIRGRFNYFTIMIALCICASINSTEEKSGVPFEKKMVLDKIFIEETGEEINRYQLYKPISVSEDNSGNIYILDAGNNCVVKYSSDAKFLKKWGNKGQGPGEFIFRDRGDPIYISDNNIIYIGEGYLSRIQSFDLDGKLLKTFITDRPADSICTDSHNNIYLSCALGSDNDSLIHVYNFNGKKIRDFSTPIVKTNKKILNENFITIDDKNNIYQVFRFLPILRKYSSSGELIFEKKIDLRKLKSIERTANFWFDYFIDQSISEYRSFTKNIMYYKSNIYISLFDTYVLSEDGVVIGFYKYDSELGKIMLPKYTIIDKTLKKFLILINENDRVGAALFDL